MPTPLTDTQVQDIEAEDTRLWRNLNDLQDSKAYQTRYMTRVIELEYDEKIREAVRLYTEHHKKLVEAYDNPLKP